MLISGAALCESAAVNCRTLKYTHTEVPSSAEPHGPSAQASASILKQIPDTQFICKSYVIFNMRNA